MFVMSIMSFIPMHWYDGVSMGVFIVVLTSLSWIVNGKKFSTFIIKFLNVCICLHIVQSQMIMMANSIHYMNKHLLIIFQNLHHINMSMKSVSP